MSYDQWKLDDPYYLTAEEEKKLTGEDVAEAAYEEWLEAAKAPA